MPHPATKIALVALAGGAAITVLANRRALKARVSGGQNMGRRPALRVVVIGAGFGGLEVASRLNSRRGVDVTVIDAHNHHLFQPLLYQVATAALSPADIASPVRGILPPSQASHVVMARVTGIDTGGRRVLCGERSVPYDRLVIATGSQTSYFGHADWADVAPSLKTLDDALNLRRHILRAFEQASRPNSADAERLLTFVLIGGGPTGVEMAGAIAVLARDMLTRDFGLPKSRARVVLVEAGPRILAAFTPELSEYAKATLQSLGVEVITGTSVTAITPDTVTLGQRSISTGNVIWTAGTEATPVAEWLGVTPAHGGRVAVGHDLRVAGFPDISVIGDAALALGQNGKPLPGLAPVAKQQGRYVAGAILRQFHGRRRAPAFVYRDYGTLATIGRTKAIAELGPMHLTGFSAWLTWAAAHIFFLIGFRNRFMVSAQWLFAYLTHERADRLIIGRDTPPGIASSAVLADTH